MYYPFKYMYSILYDSIIRYSCTLVAHICHLSWRDEHQSYDVLHFVS